MMANQGFRIRRLSDSHTQLSTITLAGADDAVPDELHEMLRSFDRIAESYGERDWEGACARAEKHLELFPEDKVVRVYLDRCRQFTTEPSPADWDGVYALKSK